MRSKQLLLASMLVLGAACGGPAPLGGSCDPAVANACVEGSVCAADETGANVCLRPLGGECTLDAEPSYCPPMAECTAVTEVVDGEERTVGRCYLPEGAACDPEQDVQCDPSLACEERVDGTHACHVPLVFRGRVIDATDQGAIADAHVLALDAQPVAVSDIAISAMDGTYALRVPAVRDMDGRPVAANYTLRASADGYETFPGGIRTAIPISTTLAVEMETEWLVMGTLTDVVLIPLGDLTAPRVSISGRVVAPGREAGVLVVANGADGHSAISDASGAYTIFNVPPGEYEVRGYAGGLQVTPVTVTAADVDLLDVDLVANESPLSTLSGMMQIVNPGDCEATSVVLAVESTFDELLGRGELPPGLRAPRPGMPPSITNNSTWTIEGVPDGRYVVLAGFENDDCVRDPDTSIAGTAIVHVELPADAGTLTETFKVTGALAVFGPGVSDPEAVTAAPTLRWEDDSGENNYLVEVFDAYGDLVWMQQVPGVSGSSMVSVAYGGPLESGMYYQFRATSRDNSGSPLSRTEDLRGVFFVP
jgi:hypothetical protein